MAAEKTEALSREKFPERGTKLTIFAKDELSLG
jgi:hypothetical protein